MTVSTTVTRVTYTGDNVSTVFGVTFPFLGPDELEAIERTIATGAEATKALNADYTVSGGNGSVGSVTATTAPADTVQWVIRRKTARTQLTDYTPNDPFPAETHERALDRAMMVSQELGEEIARTVKFPKTDDQALDPTLPSSIARAGKVLACDDNGNLVPSNLTLAELEAQPAGAAASASAAAASAVAADGSAIAAAASAAAAAAAVAEFPASLVGEAGKYLHVKDDETGYDLADTILVAAGTAAAPSLSFSGDPDTGFFSLGGGNIGVAINGTESFRLTSAGYLGIGTQDPGGPLEVQKDNDAGVMGVVFRNNADGVAAGTQLSFANNADDQDFFIRLNATSNTDLGGSRSTNFISNFGGFYFWNGYTTPSLALKIEADGTVSVPGALAVGTAAAVLTTGATAFGVNATSAGAGGAVCFAGDIASGLSSFATWSFSGTQIGRIHTVDGTSTIYGTTSDERAKEDWRDLSDEEVATLINGLYVGEHSWVANPKAGRFINFKAQQGHGVFPQGFMPGDDKMPWMRAVGAMEPILVRAMQGVFARIKQLEAR